MSEYLKKVEQDYINGKISISEKDELVKKYNELSSYNKTTLDIKAKKEKNDNTKSTRNKKYEFAKYGLERDAFWKSKYPTSRTLFRIFEVLNIISLVVLIIFLMVAVVEGIGIGIIVPSALIIGISLVFFLLGKEIILFQVDRNFFEYKQTEKLFK